MTTTGMTVKSMTESLNGYEENKVTERFGADLGDLPGTMTLRALVYVAGTRTGQDDSAAYDAAMVVPLKDIMASFEKEPDDDDRDPMAVAVSGKGGRQRTKPPGA